MPIHNDTIADGQNKTSHCLFSFLVIELCYFIHFNSVIYLGTNIPFMKTKCFNPGGFILTEIFVTLGVMVLAYDRAMRRVLETHRYGRAGLQPKGMDTIYRGVVHISLFFPLFPLQVTY